MLTVYDARLMLKSALLQTLNNQNIVVDVDEEILILRELIKDLKNEQRRQYYDFD
jgi:c-di-GMP-related signal transduction protein